MNEFMNIIHALLNHERCKVKIDEHLLRMAKYHSLVPFLFLAMDEKTTSLEIQKKVKEENYKAMLKDMVQLKELKSILKLLDENHIACLPLKGSIMKSLYPETYVRTMGDIDLLVKKEDFKQASKLILSQGYKKGKNVEHHLSLTKLPMMIIELHRMVIARKEVGFELFKDIFERCTLFENTNHIYKMSPEDFYVHMMCHLWSHFSTGGGMGIRLFIDIYLYLTHYPNLNFIYINQQLDKIHLKERAEEFKNFACHLLEQKELSEREKEILDYVVTSGTYGILSHQVKNDLSKSSANRLIIKKIFLPVDSMKNLYSYLNHWMILLPFAYIHRFFSLLFSTSVRRRAKELKKAEKKAKEEK